jgi:hypothetical protein
LEELLPKDNENVSLPILTTDGPGDLTPDSAPKPFAPAQMVRCHECLRANPPTRVTCLYCAAVLPLSETTVNLQKPALRPLEKWEQGYNNILLPRPANNAGDLADPELREAADLLRLRPSDLALILSMRTPLPLARAATIDEASLVQRRLSSLGIDTRIVPDMEPGTETGPIKVRALEIDDLGIYAFQTPETPTIRVSWSDVILLVVGRLTVKRVELKEQKGTRAENRILDASEFVTDEMAVDFYTRKQAVPYRITANSFDFSCLGQEKALLASENIATLLNFIRQRAPHAEYDDSFNSMRKALDAVWPPEQQNESTGWRLERPGKYSIGSVTELSNEMQFLRYSRLRYHFKVEKLTETNDHA